VSIQEKSLGDSDPELAKSLDLLAELCRRQSRYPEAEQLYKRALAIDEKSLGANDPQVASLLENYAVLLHQMGREQDASPVETRAKAIRNRADAG